MVIFVTIVHVIMCTTLIAIVLLQSGKGASMGAAFGGASHTLFGGTGPASFLNKVTTIAAIVFMITSFTLAVVSSRGGPSSRVLEKTPTQQTQQEEQATTPGAVEEEQEAPATAPAEDTSSSSEEVPVSTDTQEDDQNSAPE